MNYNPELYLLVHKEVLLEMERRNRHRLNRPRRRFELRRLLSFFF